jgi:hypothetical protein
MKYKEITFYKKNELRANISYFDLLNRENNSTLFPLSWCDYNKIREHFESNITKSMVKQFYWNFIRNHLYTNMQNLQQDKQFDLNVWIAYAPEKSKYKFANEPLCITYYDTKHKKYIAWAFTTTEIHYGEAVKPNMPNGSVEQFIIPFNANYKYTSQKGFDYADAQRNLTMQTHTMAQQDKLRDMINSIK